MNVERWREKEQAVKAFFQPSATFRSADDLLEAGQVFAQLTETPGWVRLLQLAGDLRISKAVEGHYDGSKRPGYYEGLLDGLQLIFDTAQHTVLAAAELQASREREEAHRRREGMRAIGTLEEGTEE